MEKRILILTAFMPGRRAGGPLFSKNLIDDLKKIYNVDVIVITTEKNRTSEVNKDWFIYYIKKIDVIVKTTLFFYLNPLFIRRFSFTVLFKLKKMIKNNHYDLIWIDYSQLFIYSLFLGKEKKIFKYHDVLLQKYLREKFYLKLLIPSTYIFEYIFSKQKNCYFVTPSKKDSLLLKKYYNQSSTHINHYICDYILNLIPNYIEKFNYYVFFGDWSRAENVEGLEWFLNSYRENIHREESFVIIGGGLNPSMKEKINNSPEFKYLGFVENPYKFISNAKALIAPIFRGAGIKIKVIEALACGTSVIGTSIAFEGISSRFTKYLYQCDNIIDYSKIFNSLNVSKNDKTLLRNDFINHYSKNTAGEFINNIICDQKLIISRQNENI